MSVAAIIQARIGSKRLPAKVLLPLPTGRTVLAEVIRQVKAIQGVDHVVVAIPDTRLDALLVPHIARAGAKHYVGPEDDVLSRYWHAAKSVGADVIMRITADCPLLDPGICTDILVEWTVHQKSEDRPDYISNVMPRTFPKGWDCEVFSWDILDFAHRNAIRADDREHVTLFMNSSWARPRITLRNFLAPNDEDWSHVNFSLDTLDDYYRICVELENRNKRRLKAG